MKKIIVVYLVGFSLPLLLLDQSAFGDVGADLSQAEGLYKAGQYAQAEQPYLKVIRVADPNKPAESEAAFTAAKGLSLVYIATDRLPQAKEAIQQLLTRPAQQQSVPTALHEIVEGAKGLQKLPQVRQLYQDMVAAKPGDSQVIWLKTGMAIASIHLADDKAAEAMLQNIVVNYGPDNRVVEALNHVAWAYRKVAQHDKALRIYQYAVDTWPQKDNAAFAQHGIVICQIGVGDLAAADKALDVLIQKFSNDTNASKLILWAAHVYASAGQTQDACKIYELVIQNYRDTPEATEAQAALAITSVQEEDRGQMEQTIQALLKQFAPNEVKALGLHNLANTLTWKYFTYVNGSSRHQDILSSIDGYLLAIANYTQRND